MCHPRRFTAMTATVTSSLGVDDMSKAQQVFEALMRTKGYTDFYQSKSGKSAVPAMQVRWAYFQLGWNMKEVTA